MKREHVWVHNGLRVAVDGYILPDSCVLCGCQRGICAPEVCPGNGQNAPEPRCSTCLHGPAVGCKLIRECGNGTESRWEEKK